MKIEEWGREQTNELDDEKEPDILFSRKGGIGGFVRIKEEEEELLERGCENEDILKLGEGDAYSVSHMHSRSSS